MSEQKRSRRGNGRSRNLLVLLFAGFVLSGIATRFIGPVAAHFHQEMVPPTTGRLGFFSNDSIPGRFGRHSGHPGRLPLGGDTARPLVLGYAFMGGGLCVPQRNHARHRSSRPLRLSVLG